MADFFRGFRGMFAEVGANDPIIGSQTAELEKQGWFGVLVEPLPHLASRLRKERASRVIEAACGSPAMAGRRLPLAVDGAHSSLDPNRIHARWDRNERILVDVVTLTSALDQAGLQQVDFLSIDAEGFQEEVLLGLDFVKFRPRLILVEDHLLGLRTHRYLVNNGYKLVRRTGLNGWYVPQEVGFAVSLFGYSQLARKYLLGIPLRRFKLWRDRWLNCLRQQLSIAYAPSYHTSGIVAPLAPDGCLLEQAQR